MRFAILILTAFMTSAVGACAQTSFSYVSQPQDIAQRLDASLAGEVFEEDTQLAPISSDEEFLRRVWLDIAGDLPSPEEAISFLLDPSPNKRHDLITKLLASRAYGQNWARYWKDVVFYRAVDDRARIASLAMEAELTRRFNDNEPWDKIASRFINTRGDVLENGTTAIVMAQDARTEETAAEVSRIFLGIQIQCAQCHDHPYDRWQREQFHELAAFFPRVGVRQVREVTRRSFLVYANDKPSRKRPKDNNNRPQSEHFMPDLEDPSAKGKKMQPRFFLTGAKVPLGTRDSRRRGQLATWLTSNEWFSIALVNRMWAELVGEGFYESVDDIGPDRIASAPGTIGILSNEFRRNGHNLKWLIETICLTDAYQRQARPRRGPTDTPFTANVPQRLRSDQLLNSIYTALEETENDAEGTSSAYGQNRLFRTRREFADVFGYDPSISREEVGTSIPQILALMNSSRLERLVGSGKSSSLKKLLGSIPDDEQLTVDIYLRWLSRQPSNEELQSVLAYRKKVDKREAAFVDLQWAILNSAEFQHRP